MLFFPPSRFAEPRGPWVKSPYPGAHRDTLWFDELELSLRSQYVDIIIDQSINSRAETLSLIKG